MAHSTSAHTQPRQADGRFGEVARAEEDSIVLSVPERDDRTVAERYADDINASDPDDQRAFLVRAGLHTTAEIDEAASDGGLDMLVEDAAERMEADVLATGGGREAVWAALNSEPPPPTFTTPTTAAELGLGDQVDLDGTIVRVTSLDGDHKSVSIEFDDDPSTIASYEFDEPMSLVIGGAGHEPSTDAAPTAGEVKKARAVEAFPGTVRSVQRAIAHYESGSGQPTDVTFAGLMLSANIATAAEAAEADGGHAEADLVEAHIDLTSALARAQGAYGKAYRPADMKALAEQMRRGIQVGEKHLRTD